MMTKKNVTVSQSARYHIIKKKFLKVQGGPRMMKLITDNRPITVWELWCFEYLEEKAD